MAQEKTAKVSGKAPLTHAVGRRKNAVARIWLRKGSGIVRVNGKELEKHFDTEMTRKTALIPFKVCPVGTNYDVDVNLCGGGKVGQADAVKLGISRAFLRMDETLRPILRKSGLLTVDSRVKERKKPGQKGARAKFQFVKR